MGIMAEPGQPQRPSRLSVRCVPLKTAQKQDITHMMGRFTAAMITTAAIAMALVVIAMVPADTARPPQHLQAHIMAEDTTAVIRRFAGSI